MVSGITYIRNAAQARWRLFANAVLPDVWGLGLAYRSAGGRFTLGLEWDRVEYSDLLDRAPGNFERELDDGDELRAGAELVILRSTPVFAARLGCQWTPSLTTLGDG